jgi:hypothetical protein
LSRSFFFRACRYAIKHTSLILNAIVEENSNAIFSLSNRHFRFAKGNSGRSDYFQRVYSLSEKMILLVNSPDDIFDRKLYWLARERDCIRWQRANLAHHFSNLDESKTRRNDGVNEAGFTGVFGERFPVRSNHCRFSCGLMVRDARRRAPHHEGVA